MNILILGATGSVARVATDELLRHPDVSLTLYARRSVQLTSSTRSRVIIGDVLDLTQLKAAMIGQNVVYANLAGELVSMARNVVQAMNETGLQRLIWVSSMGIYGEVPGERYRSILDPYRDSVHVIEQSTLDYTVLRPGWFTNAKTRGYEITRKGEAFRGHDISRVALASLIAKLATTPGLESHQSLGVSDAS
jgi:nucleoside-diphosphate-sugar epimerase